MVIDNTGGSGTERPTTLLIMDAELLNKNTSTERSTYV